MTEEKSETEDKSIPEESTQNKIGTVTVAKNDDEEAEDENADDDNEDSQKNKCCSEQSKSSECTCSAKQS